MVEIKDIVDRVSLHAWLNEQPRRYSVVIAHRAAMRLLPENLRWMLHGEAAPRNDMTALTALWPSLISGVVSFWPTPEITADMRRQVTAAVKAADFASGHAAAATLYAIDAASETSEHTAAHNATDATAAYAAAFDADKWGVIRSDCSMLLEGRNISGTRLWANETNPLQEEWQEVKRALGNDEVDWGFWIKWYEAALEGKPLPWSLLERIALEVTEEDWKQKPAHVNGLIAGIEAAFLRDATPLNEKLVVSEESGEVFSEPVEAKQPDLMATHLQRIEDALKRALKNNGLTEESLETNILFDLFAKFRNDPERVEMDLVEVVGSLNSQISNNWLPDSPVINSLINSCRQGALDIRAMNPELAENRAIRARQAAREMTGEEKAILEDGIEAIKPLLREDLREQFESDFKRLINDAIGPLPEGAPPLPAPDPAMRMANRIAKVSLMVRLDEAVKKLKKNPLYNAGEVATQTAALVALFYKVFTLIA